MPARVRWFTCTNWNVECDYDEIIRKIPNLRFVAYGPEVCPDTGTKHHQVYFYVWKDQTRSKKALGKYGSWWGSQHCHVEPMFGKVTENEGYCSKENAGKLIKHGDEPKQGCRDDLDETKEKIMKGDLTVDQICVENPGFFHQYGRTMERLQTIAQRQRYRTWKTVTWWWTGPSKSGKTWHCFQGYDPDTYYVKNLGEGDLKWWDGYNGQPIVILNEFRGQIQFAEMLDLMDEWPKDVAVRGQEKRPFLAREIRISSIKTPEQVYCHRDKEEDWEQWSRRCTTVHLPPRGCKRSPPDGPLTTEVKEAVARAKKTARMAREKKESQKGQTGQ